MLRRDHPLRVDDGLTLWVSEWGDAAARPVVMLHGIRGYAETFAGVAEALQPHWRVIAFDQRGRGRSDWDPAGHYYTDRYVRDLAQVVDQLKLDRFDLLGHSMGGINAIVYAAQHARRVDRLVIEDAGPGAFERSAGAMRIRTELAGTPERFASWEEAADFMRALRPSVSEAARESRLRSMLKSEPGGGFCWRYDHGGIRQTRLHPDPARVPALEAPVRALACPTLVLRGGRSDYLQPDMVGRMQSLNSRIHALTIEGAGHYIHDDQPQAFVEAVRSFLAQGRPSHGE